ncbi:MAG: HIT domain-containing protein [Candidatus Pacebacteria bacterium]|nr:HIT domain-containing protein [Candidatus Paceibacterota bacterium]MDD5356928.1 HIT domain-containing protein [Candidatus Paceibacterota bacterium]
MAKTKKSFVNIANSKRGVYEEVIKKIAKQKVCPFCEEELHKHHERPIHQKGAYWIATDNMYPYKNTKVHLLFIHRKHISDITEMSKEAWEELRSMMKDFIQKKKTPGGILHMRFGDTRYTGASVQHLHAHLISPDLKAEKQFGFKWEEKE